MKKLSFQNCPLSILGISRWELVSWSANRIELGLTAQTCTSTYLTYCTQLLHNMRIKGCRVFYFQAIFSVQSKLTWKDYLTLNMLNFLKWNDLSSIFGTVNYHSLGYQMRIWKLVSQQNRAWSDCTNGRLAWLLYWWQRLITIVSSSIKVNTLSYPTSSLNSCSSLCIISIPYSSFMVKSIARPSLPDLFPLVLFTEFAWTYSKNIHLSLFLPRPEITNKSW